MISRRALAIVLAGACAVQNASAFVPSALSAHIVQRPITTLFESEGATEQQQQTDATTEASVDAGSEEKLIMDIPPAPAAAKKKAPPAKKKGGNPHKEGVFSPIVVAAGAVLGEETLNKVRGKVIALHSDVIKSFVDTSDSDFGKAVLRQLFDLVDEDNSGYLDKAEVEKALGMLGFSWLGEKQVNKIFERADANGDCEISLEEFMEEAPKTLRANLIKLAKKNGGDMGLLV
jgi:hypothetical protein